MAVEVKMPQLSDTMDAGKILSWKKKVGDKVTRGDILAEVETEKANLEIEAYQQGVVLEIRVNENQSAKVGEIIAVIGQPGESAVATPSKIVVESQPMQQPPTGNIINTTPTGTLLHMPSQPQRVVAQSDSRIKVSPLARKVAEQMNVDLATVRGTGPNGRIVRRDIEAPVPNQIIQQVAQQVVAPTPVPEVARPASNDPRFTPLSKMRETIARRMQESVTQAPHFYVTSVIDMTEAVRLREILKEKAEYKGVSINHFVIKAVAYGLENEPRVNRAMRDGMQYDPGIINIGIITAIDDGLLIPVIKEANQLSLKDVVFEARAAIDRARAGRPSATDLVGGTFSISNMGMYDVENFTAIINPGQGGVLAVSSVKDEAVVREEKVVIRKIMRVTVSVDHRVIDGVMAGTFLKFFKEALETPALLMV